MKSIILAVTVLTLLSGCAGFKPAERWVDNNTFYSTKLPGIEVQVDQSLRYKQSPQMGYLAESSRGNVYAGLDTEWFYFIDQGRANLGINIETLANQQRIYMAKLEWSKYPGILLASEQTINGTEFATGIIRESSDNVTSLAKVYSTKIDDTTRYKIVYKEKVDAGWMTKTTNFLTTEDRNFLDGFNKRADESFSIAPYSGKQPPEPPAQ